MPLLTRRINDGAELVYGWFGAMHSRFDVAFVGTPGDRGALEKVMQECREIVQTIESTGSCHAPESLICRMASQGAAPTPMLSEILQACAEGSHLTLGYFSTSASGRNVPDLCGFLKGYAADSLLSHLTALGYMDVLINAGNSSVVAVGNAPGADGWPVGVDGTDTSVTLRNSALSVSGNLGRTSPHIIDPISGSIVTAQNAVLVLGPSAATSEILSTALFAAPPALRTQIITHFPTYSFHSLNTNSFQ